jgi:membrane-associated phospholipid phosphatase
MYPASILVSLTVFAVGSAVLWRRGERVAAVVWGAAWFVANGIEVAVKAAIAKPALYVADSGKPQHLLEFDHSFPSGHAMRAVLVAGVLLYVWRRVGLVAAAWAALMPIFLVAASWHVPSDVAGGIVFGLIAVLTAYAAIAAVSARRA